MKVPRAACLAFQISIFLSVFISNYAFDCDNFFVNQDEIVCIRNQNEKVSYFKKFYSKLECSKIDVKIQPRRLLKFIDCPLDFLTNSKFEPFEVLNLYTNGEATNPIKIETFSTGDENPSTLLSKGLFAYFITLENITLSNANINYIEEGAFDMLLSLKYLCLSRNKIKDLPVGIFWYMRIEHLDLSSNRIDKLQESIFFPLSKLETLDIHSNCITTLPNRIFQYLENLQDLRLDDNKLETLDTSIFLGLKKLKKLNLRNNKLKTIDYVFRKNPLLEYLDVSLNAITNVSEDMFVEHTGLIYLDMSDNRLENIPPKIFDTLENLTYLTLSNNQISELEDRTFQNLHLVKLYINGNFLETVPGIWSKYFDTFSILEWNTFIRELILDLLYEYGIDLSIKENEQTNELQNALFSILDTDKLKEAFENGFNEYGMELSIRENKVKNLPKKNLAVVLDISRNTEVILTNDTFASWPLLKILRMKECNLTSIPVNIFQNTSLLYLSLAKNGIKTIEQGTFDEIKDLDLSFNKIEKISNHTFRSSSLRHLNLSHNSLTNVEIFLKTKHSKNAIHNLSLNSVLFDGMAVLQKELNKPGLINSSDRTLALNMLNNIPTKAQEMINNLFRASSNGNFVLDMSYNLLTELKIDIHDMIYLNIGHNLITSLDDVNVGDNKTLQNVRVLDISFNKLSIITQEHMNLVINLRQFIAQNNDITEITIPENCRLEVNSELHNRELHFESNKINRIRILDTMNRQSNLSERCNSNAFFVHTRYFSVKLYMAGNPIACDCSAYKLYTYLNEYNSSLHYVEFHNVTCQYPLELRGRSLKDVKVSEFACTYTQDPSKFQCDTDCDCVKICTCSHRLYDDFRTVNCSNENYWNLPRHVPKNTNLLDMNQNNLSSLAELSQTRWGNLTEFHAENNIIDSADFVIPKKMTFLGLKGNKLKKFPLSIDAHAAKEKGFKVTLSENPWPCDCSVRPLKRFLLNHLNQAIDYDKITCTFLNHSSAVLIKVNDLELCPPPQKTEVHEATYAVSSLLFVVCVVIFLYYKYKRYILLFLFIRFNRCYRLFCCGTHLDDNKRYDAFVSYSSKDEDVTFGMIQELEEKPPHYKLCIHLRDWLPGFLISDHIFHSVENSRKTIVVVSETYVRSRWFRLEFQAAFRQTLTDRRDRLIVIVKGDLPDSSEMPPDLRFVLATKTYLKWGERWFFEKLRHALHEERPFFEQDPVSGGILNCFRRRNAAVQSVEMHQI